MVGLSSHPRQKFPNGANATYPPLNISLPKLPYHSQGAARNDGAAAGGRGTRNMSGLLSSGGRRNASCGGQLARVTSAQPSQNSVYPLHCEAGRRAQEPDYPSGCSADYERDDDSTEQRQSRALAPELGTLAGQPDMMPRVVPSLRRALWGRYAMCNCIA